MKVGALILAAGGSARLGRAKQLLPIGEDALLRHSVRVALGSEASPVTVVLGAEAGACALEIADLPARVVVHSGWRDGIASSIVAGLEALCRADPRLNSVVIMVCDQPHVTAAVIDALIEAHIKTGKGMVACSYAGIEGVPALFGRAYFDALLGLQGDQGARSLFKAVPGDFASIVFPEGGVDIDTPGDYQRLMVAS